MWTDLALLLPPLPVGVVPTMPSSRLSGPTRSPRLPSEEVEEAVETGVGGGGNGGITAEAGGTAANESVLSCNRVGKGGKEATKLVVSLKPSELLSAPMPFFTPLLSLLEAVTGGSGEEGIRDKPLADAAVVDDIDAARFSQKDALLGGDDVLLGGNDVKEDATAKSGRDPEFETANGSTGLKDCLHGQKRDGCVTMGILLGGFGRRGGTLHVGKGGRIERLDKLDGRHWNTCSDESVCHVGGD